MPPVTRPITPLGPIIEVTIGPSQLLVQQLQQAGQPIPPSISTTGLVDTGATGTVIIPSIPGRLGLSPVGIVPTITSTTTTAVPSSRFQISLILPNLNIPILVVTEAVRDFPGFDCLIGRDVLNRGRLLYDGTGGTFTLEF